MSLSCHAARAAKFLPRHCKLQCHCRSLPSGYSASVPKVAKPATCPPKLYSRTQRESSMGSMHESMPMAAGNLKVGRRRTCRDAGAGTSRIMQKKWSLFARSLPGTPTQLCSSPSRREPTHVVVTCMARPFPPRPPPTCARRSARRLLRFPVPAMLRSCPRAPMPSHANDIAAQRCPRAPVSAQRRRWVCTRAQAHTNSTTDHSETCTSPSAALHSAAPAQ